MKPLDIRQLDKGREAPPPGEAQAEAVRPRAALWRGVAQAALALVVLAAGFAGYRALLAAKQPVAQRPALERVWAVETVPVVYDSHRPLLVVYGEAVAARRAEMRALVPGEIVRVGANLREGGTVAHGETLVEIDPFGYRGALTEARANLAEAEARLAEREALIALQRDTLVRAGEQLAIARRDHERALELHRGGTMTDKALDDRRLVLSQREQAAEQARSNLAAEQARADQQRAQISRLQWRVEQAERSLADTVLRAPFDAHVRGVNAEVGRNLGINDVVAVLLDRAGVEVRVTLSDRQYGRIVAEDGTLVGRPVEIVWTLGAQERTYAGRIVRLAAEIATQSGGVDVFVAVDLTGAAADLRPGAFVEVRVPDRTYDNAVRLPESALYGGDTVYAVVDGRLASRRIELLGRDRDAIFVAGDIAPGERIIVTRISEIGEGLRVEEPR